MSFRPKDGLALLGMLSSIRSRHRNFTGLHAVGRIFARPADGRSFQEVGCPPACRGMAGIAACNWQRSCRSHHWLASQPYQRSWLATAAGCRVFDPRPAARRAIPQYVTARTIAALSDLVSVGCNILTHRTAVNEGARGGAEIVERQLRTGLEAGDDGAESRSRTASW